MDADEVRLLSRRWEMAREKGHFVAGAKRPSFQERTPGRNCKPVQGPLTAPLQEDTVREPTRPARLSVAQHLRWAPPPGLVLMAPDF